MAFVLRRWVSRLGLACLLSVPALAHAQDPSELKKARAQFQQATELEQAGNWTAALQAFREVGQVRMTPQVRFHIAVCEEKLGRLVAALGGYELALADADRVNPDFKGEVEENVSKLRSRIPKLVIQRGAGAESAAIELDGVALGASSIGIEVPLDPGPHAVTARAPNRKPYEASVTLKEQEVAQLEITLEAAPIEQSAAPIGPRPPDRPPSKLVPYVIGGVGVASLVGSGVLFVLRQGTISELDDACGKDHNACPKSKESRYADLKFYHYGAQVTLGVGIVALGTAGALLYFQRKKPQERAPSAASLALLPVLPLAAGAPAGAALHGRF